jgi:hypothetical protein
VAVATVVPELDTAETAVPEQPPVPVEIAVAVVEVTAAPAGRRGGSTPTPGLTQGVADVRVQVVTVFGDVLVEAVTPATGRVDFTRAVPPGTALYVQLPALGLRTQLPAAEVQAGKAAVMIVVPAGVR